MSSITSLLSNWKVHKPSDETINQIAFICLFCAGYAFAVIYTFGESRPPMVGLAFDISLIGIIISCGIIGIVYLLSVFSEMIDEYFSE